MEIPIRVVERNGEYVAGILGSDEMQATHRTRDGAIAMLSAAVSAKIASGIISAIDIPTGGLLALAGKYKDDESLREICEEIYRQRDAEPKE